MRRCGIPTIAFILLLLSMAALYASAELGEADAGVDMAPQPEWSQMIQVRAARSAQVPVFERVNVNSRGRQGRIADGTEVEIGGGRRRGGRRGNGSGRRDRPGRGRGRGRGGRRRGNGRRPGRIPLVEGVSRREMNLAVKLHNASSVFGSRLVKEAFGPQIQYNTVMSPYSIHVAMSMISLGARRGTQREILGTLGLPQTGLRRRMIHRAYKALIRLLAQETENATLDTANAVYVKPNIPLESNFRRGLIENYNARFETFNFEAAGGPEAPINQWVSDSTRGKISSILAPGSIGRSTPMVLLNAVYFKAKFKTAFDQEATAPRDFRTLSRGVQQIPTMTVTSTYNFIDRYNTQIVELPYAGGKHALYVLIPHATSSVDQLLNDLQDTDRFGINPVHAFIKDLIPTEIEFHMPKFTIDSGSVYLKRHLRTMGIERAFDARADFTGITPVPISIQDVIHKAFIEINEEGTEAAAVTAIVFELSAFPSSRTPVIKANRPFIYMVRDTQLNTILFMGTFMGQTKDETQM